MENKKSLREKLLNIIEENLSFDNISYYTSGDPWYTFTVVGEKFKNVKQAFIEAGLEREVQRRNLANYLVTPVPHQEHKPRTDRNFETMVWFLSDIKYSFLQIINDNTELEFENGLDIDRISKFVGEYLAGFIYDPSYWNFLKMSTSGINRIKSLYAYYGLDLTEEEINKMVKVALKEKENKDEKKALPKPSSVKTDIERLCYVYFPEIISKYIAEDIVNKLTLNKTSEIKTGALEDDKADVIIQKENLEVKPNNTEEISNDVSNLTITEKINLIKQKLEQLEKLSEQEKELSSTIEKIKFERNKLTQEINNIKL